MNAQLHTDNLSDNATNKPIQHSAPRRSFAVLIVFALIALGLTILLRPTLYYPYLVITGPEDIHIHILQRGQKQASQCARSLASQAAAIHGSCPVCQIETSDCPSNLESSKQRWLDEKPIELPSARMAYGVIVFEAPQQQFALASCQESERQSLSNTLASRVKCFPAGTKRPLLSIEKDIFAQEHAERQRSLIVAMASIVGLIALVVGSLALLRRFAARGPLENTSIEIPATLKLSNILKRIVDILIAATLLIALLPILLLVATLIRIFEGTPIFYMSHRLISADKSVTIFKFRTMVKDATSPKYRLRERFMRDGYLDIPLTCEVYTLIGRLLERSQLVETLQLLNILFDGMSFVGNRPLPKDNIELLKKFGGWQERFDSPAGITGISQIVGKYGLLPQQRLYLERMYSNVYKNPDGNILLSDLYIIGYTVLLLFTGRHLDYGKAVALLIRCGANKDLPACVPHEPKCADANNERLNY